jgi:hypothetical protein
VVFDKTRSLRLNVILESVQSNRIGLKFNAAVHPNCAVKCIQAFIGKHLGCQFGSISGERCRLLARAGDDAREVASRWRA